MIGGKRSKRTHTDLGAKRLEKDSQCVKMMTAWFSTHNPFIEVSTDSFDLLITAQNYAVFELLHTKNFTSIFVKRYFVFSVISGTRPQHHYFLISWSNN